MGEKIGLNPWENMSKEERDNAYKAFQAGLGSSKKRAVREYLEGKKFVCPNCSKSIERVLVCITGQAYIALKGSVVEDIGEASIDDYSITEDCQPTCPECGREVEVYFQDNIQDKMFEALGLKEEEEEKKDV